MGAPLVPHLRKLRFRLGLLALGLLGAGFLAAWLWADRTMVRMVLESPLSGRCNRELSRGVLDRSLTLGTRYLLEHQKPAGNFDYEYDWRAKTLSADDNEVRQAGALWVLSLIYLDRATPELAAAIEKGLGFFAEHSLVSNETRCVAYPGSPEGTTGTTALVALALVDYLRAAAASLPEALRRSHEAQLAQYLKQLAGAVNSEGVFYGNYEPRTCAPQGAHSPYSDGEALLALVKAAKYLGHRELEPLIRRAAAAGYLVNIERALAVDSDSDLTKGYYQWSSMAFFELATSNWPDSERFGDHVLRLADWMIDVHRTLIRNKNTGYAYEGLTHAYELARRRGDTVRVARYACVLDLGLGRLISWQVGGPLSNGYTRKVNSDDQRAIGGVQNAANEPGLRIDVTGHQMHATILARRYVYAR